MTHFENITSKIQPFNNYYSITFSRDGICNNNDNDDDDPIFSCQDFLYKHYICNGKFVFLVSLYFVYLYASSRMPCSCK